MKSFIFLEVLFERIDRSSVGIKVLKEHFERNGQIGYLAHERLEAHPSGSGQGADNNTGAGVIRP